MDRARHFICQQGHKHWGQFGAAGLFIFYHDPDTGKDYVLLTRRSAYVMNPFTWSIPGGAIDEGEHPTDAALREAGEELSEMPLLNYVATIVNDHGDWAYHTVIVRAHRFFTVDLNWEADRAQWVPLDEIVTMEHLHEGLAANLPEVLDAVRNRNRSGVVLPR